jgi:hypothetical protein
MNQQNNREANNPQSVIEDLAINGEQAAEVKGGCDVNPRSTELSGAVWSGVYDR